MKKTIIVIIVQIFSSILIAQTYLPTQENLSARASFQDMKLGMFIHWGLSSVLGAGEWVMNNRNIEVHQYSRLLQIFNPQQFDAKKWVAAAKSGGMKYITFITRHHDGFSNWDTQQSDWKITNTPYGKDALKQLADECHQQGIKLFCYYSLLDWYRSDYQYETGKTGKGSGRTEKSNWNHYLQFMKAQLTELLTNYGKIDGIWFDGHWDQLDNDYDKTLSSKVNWHYDEIYKLIHLLQPQCLISNNHHLTPIPGEDFQAFEKDLPGGNTTGFGGATVSALPLETCETMNNSWGFNITDKNYKSSKELIHYLVKAAGHNANFLLNIGPMPDGNIQPEFTDTLKLLGKWMEKYGNTIYGTRGGNDKVFDWGVITTTEAQWYVHILQFPVQTPFIFIPMVNKKVLSCTLFNSTLPIKFKQVNEGLFLYVDRLSMDNIDTILTLKIE